MIIGIGIHGWTHVQVESYYNHLSALAHWQRWAIENGYTLGFAGERRTIVVKARNKIAKDLLELNADYWLALDTDHLVQPELLEMLFKVAQHEDAAMVSGLITKRIYPYETVAFKFASDSKDFLGVHIPPSTGVREVDACAMGCTLIDLRKLQKLPQPWFQDITNLRSDLHLCLKFRRAGERIFVHSDAHVCHLGDPLLVTPEGAEKLRVEYNQRNVPKDADDVRTRP